MNQQDHNDYAYRLLEEWKVNNDLFKFHEDLKQKRFSYFITIQTAFIALYGILLKETLLEENILIPLALLALVFPPLFIVAKYAAMDKRARVYVDTIKGKLLLIENYWKEKYPANCFSTYSEQFDVLVHRKMEIVDCYIAVRGLKEKDPFRDRIYSKAAHIGEEKVFLMFKVFWLFFLVTAVVIFGYRLWQKF